MEVIDIVNKSYLTGWAIVGILVLIPVSLGIYSILRDCCYNQKIKFIVSPIVWLGTIIFIIALLKGDLSISEQRYILKVDETVTVHELYEKYDVKEKKDYVDIFEVTPRKKHAE